MVGTPKLVTAEPAGKPLPDDVLKTKKLVVAGGRYAVTVGEEADEGTVKLDTGKKPKALDIEGTKGRKKGKTILAVYELKSNTLRVCYDLGGKASPAEFEPGAGTQLFLVEYMRQKP